MASRHDAEAHARAPRLYGAAAALCLLLAGAAAAQPARAPPPPPALTAKDGPLQVTFGMLFKEGKTEFDDIDPATVGPLPKGYEPFGKAAYKIQTEAVVVGPHLLEISLPSVDDRKVFEGLRVLHAVWDKVDEKFFWEDSGHLIEDAIRHDFGARKLTVRTEKLGSFALARVVGPFDPLKDADLLVEIVPPQGRIDGNTDAHYEIRVTNRGPDDAADIRLGGAGFSSNQFVSASGPERGRGRCRQDGSNYGCKLDLLPKGETAVFRIVLNPRENPRQRLPEEGRSFNLVATAHSRTADDKNFDDNHAESWIKVYPDPNRAPSVELLTPGQDDLFAPGAPIRLSARAKDPEGGLSKVEFYDGERRLGEGVASGKDEYSFDWAGAKPGHHIITVVVTDSGGRGDYETRVTFVNGPLTARVESPREGAVLQTKYTLKGENEIGVEPVKLEMSASVGGPRVREVSFSVSSGSSVMPGGRGLEKIAGRAAGTDPATGETRYTAVLEGIGPGFYRLTALAVDEDGVETYSRPAGVRVSAITPVRLTAREVERGPGLAPEVHVTAQNVMHALHSLYGTDPAEKEVRVDFYAGGRQIGTARMDSFAGTTRFVWSDPPPGTHELTAVATNGDGATSHPSPPLRLTVRGSRQ